MHLQRLAATVHPLDPLLVYLWQPDTRATLKRAAAVRPTEWLDFVIGYVTGQAWGSAAGQAGFDGMVAFYEMRKAIELAALPDLASRRLRWRTPIRRPPCLRSWHA